jgi:putative restriction endonuclease
MDAHGLAVRLAAFDHLRGRDTVTWQELVHGFSFEGERYPLISQRGINRLRRIGPVPLSVATAPERPGRERPYDDRLGADDTIQYRYFGTDPSHPDNVGLRIAAAERVPLVYLYGLERSVYAPLFPVFVIRDDPATLSVTLQVDVGAASLSLPQVSEDRAALRAYVTQAAKKRLHQFAFSRHVLHAYGRRCAMCRLRHVLDAAHILPDGHPRGDPVVPNGLALCRLHHAVFDADIVGLHPDYRLVVRSDVLDEEDGPVLEHGLKRLHGSTILLPRRAASHPDRERVAERFEKFQRAG